MQAAAGGLNERPEMCTLALPMVIVKKGAYPKTWEIPQVVAGNHMNRDMAVSMSVGWSDTSVGQIGAQDA